LILHFHSRQSIETATLSTKLIISQVAVKFFVSSVEVEENHDVLGYRREGLSTQKREGECARPNQA
jgi:hypothetical protein